MNSPRRTPSHGSTFPHSPFENITKTVGNPRVWFTEEIRGAPERFPVQLRIASTSRLPRQGPSGGNPPPHPPGHALLPPADPQTDGIPYRGIPPGRNRSRRESVPLPRRGGTVPACPFRGTGGAADRA